MKEIWRPVKGYEGLYEVSNLGNVRSNYKANRINKNGLLKGYAGVRYKMVILCKEGVKKMHTVHRLVAIAFIPNPEGKRCVNHKNGIKTDNRVENLEWCTHSENVSHAFSLGLNYVSELHRDTARRIGAINGRKNAKRVVDTKTGIVYNSLTDAAESVGIDKRNLCNMLNGRRKNNTGLKYA